MLSLVAAAESEKKEAQEEQEAARNQATLGGIQAAVEAAEGPELTGTVEQSEAGGKRAGQPGNVEFGGTKSGLAVAGSTEDLMGIGSRDAGSPGHWGAAEGTNPAEVLRGE